MLKNALPALIFTIISLQSCNSDIFVEPIPEVIDTIMLSGTGEERTFKIPTKGLASVDFFDNSPNTYATTRYYNKAGDEIMQFGSIGEIAKITYGSQRFTIEFNINGDEVTVKALDNTYQHNIDVTASLDYGYESREIKIIMTPGAMMQITFFGYDILHPVCDTRTETGPLSRVTNNTDQTQRIGIYPYKNAPSRIETTADDETWQEGITGDVNVPYFSKGEWIDDGSFKTLVTIGSTNHYISPNTPEDELTYLEIPPHTTVSSTLSVTYATLDVAYLAEYTQPGSGFAWPSSGHCRIFQPISYELKVIEP